MKKSLQPLKTLFLFLLLFSGINEMRSQCAVNFSYTQNPGGYLTFTATPTNSLASYWWNFGDGSTTGGTGMDQVSHTYAANGTYTVVMSYSASTCWGTMTQTVTVSSSACNLAMNASLT
jgi:PKD repeat protein